MPKGSMATLPARWVGVNGEVVHDPKPALWGEILISDKHGWAMPPVAATRQYEFRGAHLVKTGEGYVYLDDTPDPYLGAGMELNVGFPRAFEEGQSGQWKKRGFGRGFLHQFKHVLFALSVLAIGALMYFEWSGNENAIREDRRIAAEERRAEIEIRRDALRRQLAGEGQDAQAPTVE